MHKRLSEVQRRRGRVLARTSDGKVIRGNVVESPGYIVWKAWDNVGQTLYSVTRPRPGVTRAGDL